MLVPGQKVRDVLCLMAVSMPKSVSLCCIPLASAAPSPCLATGTVPSPRLSRGF